MPAPLEPKKIDSIGVYGLIRPAKVSDPLIPDGAVTDVVNYHFDIKGAASVRPGMTALGSTVLTARPCVGLFNAQQGTAISVFSNGASSAIYTLSSGVWGLSLDGGTASVKVNFVDFGSYTIAVNFAQNTYSSMRFWNAGSSRHWHFTGNPINPQNMWGYTPQFGEVFKNRVHLFGDTSVEGGKSRLFYSSVISNAGNITWSPLTDFVDINPGDGEGGTGMRRYSLELLLFKPNYIYRYRIQNVDPDPLIKVGTRSNESIQEGKKGLYFHHDTGFYRYSGGYPVEISQPISDFVQAIPFSQYSNIVAWNDADNIYWSVGNLTITEAGLSETYRNTILRYTEASDLWTVYCTPSEVRRGMSFNSGSAISRVVGLDNGVVATANSGVTDLGEPIKYRVRTKWIDWGNISSRKIMNEIVAVCEKAQAQEVFYQVDEETTWRSVIQTKKLINFADNLSIRFHRIRFKIIGVSKFESPIFRSIEIPKGINEGLVKE